MFLRKRIYGSTKNISLSRLKEFFEDSRFSYVTFALLFGSRASETHHAQSDYDIAILTDDNTAFDWGVLAKAYNDIGEITGLKDYDYDIIDLKKASSFMKNNIKRNYKILKGDKDDFQRIFAQ